MVEVQGRLIEIIYQNESNGYLVGTVYTEEEDVTIVGVLPALREGEELLLKGKWVTHPSYGRQLEVATYQPIYPTTIQGMISYLSSGLIKGIGEKMARRIVEQFGTETLEVLQYEPQRLAEVPGIGEAKAAAIGETFQEQRELREILLFLAPYGISPHYAIKIYKIYGEQTVPLLQENPYRLAEEIGGIGFRKADQIAATMGVAPDSKYRLYAAVRYGLNTLHGEGHTYVPVTLLIAKTTELVGGPGEKIEEAIQDLALDQKIQLERAGEELRVSAMPYYYAEVNSCNRIIALTQAGISPHGLDLDREICSIEEEAGIQLAPDQKRAIKAAVENGIMIITGGPGTGKTTIINALIHIFHKLRLKIVLAAPTGRAAKRMTETTGQEAKTIHRLLEMTYRDEQHEMVFQKNEEDPLEADVIIVDEMSMVDILLLHSLLKAIPAGCRLVMVGDVDQLPPVGAGNVLKDMIESQLVPTVRLTEIFRQAQESMIVVNAHRINRGEAPQCNVKDKDFYFMGRASQEEIFQTLLQLVKERLPQHYGVDALKDIQVLSPMKKGVVGTIQLNRGLQKMLNPPQHGKIEKEYGERLYRIGDKVMQIKNNYSLLWRSVDGKEEGEGVFNGDMGCIASIDLEQQELEVIFDEHRLVTYSFNQLDELELAYCVTVHKGQGSEFPIVVMPITWGPPMLLTRNLLYTAVTRARQLVVLVGKEAYLQEMVRNDKIVQRYSGLGWRLMRYVQFQQGESSYNLI